MDGLIWAKANWDRIAGWGLLGLGVVLLVVGAVRVSDARYLADQLSILMTAGVGGLGAVVAGSAFLVTSALHDEWRKLDALEAALRDADRSGSAGVDVAGTELRSMPGDLALGGVTTSKRP